MRGKKKLHPEKDVMVVHMLGDGLDNVKMDDPLTLDGLIQKTDETTIQQIDRDARARDGSQPEGMVPPVEAFEYDAMIRQLDKKQEVYG
jgi:hypothetical protein